MKIDILSYDWKVLTDHEKSILERKVITDWLLKWKGLWFLSSFFKIFSWEIPKNIEEYWIWAEAQEFLWLTKEEVDKMLNE